ncbi:MAG: LytTR family transcriptional regulator DNA-binding domain-containing protein [Clostridia bacterium]|nr:LytTR family transcriptional regulator DNA-binding domain-containing protein [Clostridia bacterium]
MRHRKLGLFESRSVSPYRFPEIYKLFRRELIVFNGKFAHDCRLLVCVGFIIPQTRINSTNGSREYPLAQLEQILSTVNFFRCSKSVIININKVKKLKSLASNRIGATMCSGEHIMISRTYASDFRKRLKGVSVND